MTEYKTMWRNSVNLESDMGQCISKHPIDNFKLQNKFDQISSLKLSKSFIPLKNIIDILKTYLHLLQNVNNTLQ